MCSNSVDSAQSCDFEVNQAKIRGGCQSEEKWYLTILRVICLYKQIWETGIYKREEISNMSKDFFGSENTKNFGSDFNVSGIFCTTLPTVDPSCLRIVEFGSIVMSK